MKGRGSYVASDLTDFAEHHAPDEIRESILEPRVFDERRLESVTVVTRDGRKVAGIVRHEDNFSLQLQDAQGQFYLLVKSELARIDRTAGPAMPRDYAKRLSSRELDDVVSYIASQSPAGSGTPAADTATRVKRP